MSNGESRMRRSRPASRAGNGADRSIGAIFTIGNEHRPVDRPTSRRVGGSSRENVHSKLDGKGRTGAIGRVT
jgi:hypothetical protein